MTLKNLVKNFHKKRSIHLPGFSLIELALVLIIIGILAGTIFKGQDVLAAAKIRSVLTEIDRIRTAATLYHDTFGQWPGNDSMARARFGQDVTNGQGNGIISGTETHQFWAHLAKAEYIPDSAPPSSKLGGHFSVEGNGGQRQNFLVLSQSDRGGVLTPKQAAALKAKAGENDPSTGQIHVIEGAGSAAGSCIRDGTYNLTTTTPTCILRVELH
jgi:prepilin-type N-terminal cleavage/methylation domain-containing protein